MSKKDDEKSKPTVKSLIDTIVSPEAVARLQNRQRGKPSTAVQKTDRSNNEKSEKEKLSTTAPLEQNPDKPSHTARISSGILKFERIIKVKTAKLWHLVMSKLIGNAKRTNFHMQQRRMATKLLSLSVDWKRRQHLFRSLKHMSGLTKAKGRVPKYVPTMARVFNRIAKKKLTYAFQQLMNWNIHERSVSQQSESNQASLMSLPLDSNDPRRVKAAQSARFVRKPSTSQFVKTQPQPLLSDRPFNKEDEDLKKMALSVQCREALEKMQRFDKFIYAQQSQKNLKGPIQAEVRRLQRVKNSDRTLRNIFFDTELSMNVILNHIKTISDFNRSSQQRDTFKLKVQELQQKIIQNNVQKQKQIKELTEKLRGKPQVGDQNSRLKALETELREHKKLNEVIIQSAKEPERLKRLLQVQIKRHQSETGRELSLDRKQLIEFILGMVSQIKPTEQTQQPTTTSFSPVNDLKSDLKNLLAEQSSIQKNLTYLQRQKKILESRQSDAKRAEFCQLYSILASGSVYLSNLYTNLKAKNQELTQLNRRIQEIQREKQKTERLQSQSQEKGQQSLSKIKADLEAQRNKTKQLEKKLTQCTKKQIYQKEQPKDVQIDSPLKDWQSLLSGIINKIDNQDKTWQSQIHKQRKLLNTKRQTDKFTNLISLNISILEYFIKRQKDIQQLSTQISIQKVHNQKQQTEDKLNKQKIKQFTQERNLLKKQAQQANKTNDPPKKESVNNQLIELAKVLNNIEQLIKVAPREGEEQQQTLTQWIKIKRMLDKRKYPSLQSITSFIELMIKITSENDDIQRKRQGQLARTETAKTREINSMSALIKSVQRILDDKNFKFDQISISRLRKVLEANLVKYDKTSQTNPHIGWLSNFKDGTAISLRILTLAQIDRANTIAQVDQLQSYIAQLQTQLKNDKANSDRYYAQTAKTVMQLESQLKSFQQKASSNQSEQMKLVDELQNERGSLQTKLQKRQQDVKRLEDKCRNQQIRVNEQSKEIKQFKQSIDIYSKQEKAMLNEIEILQKANQQLQAQLSIIQSGASQHDRERLRVQHQRSQLNNAQGKIKQLYQQVEKKEQQRKRVEIMYKGKLDQLQRDLRNVESNLNQLLQANMKLEAERLELERMLVQKQSESGEQHSVNPEIEKLTHQNFRLSSDLSQILEKISILEHNYQTVEEQNIKLKHILHNKESQFTLNTNRLSKDLDFSQKQNKTLRNTIEQLEKKIDNILSERERVTMELSRQRGIEDQFESMVNELKQKLFSTEARLSQALSQPPDAKILDEIKADYSRKQQKYKDFLKQIREMAQKDQQIAADKSAEVIKLSSELNKMQQQNNRLRGQLQSIEKIFKSSQNERESSILRREKAYQGQIQILKKQIEQITREHNEDISKIQTDYQRRERDLQSINQETLDSWFQKQKELQTQISKLKAIKSRPTEVMAPTIQVSQQGQVLDNETLQLLEYDLAQAKQQLLRSAELIRQKQQQCKRLLLQRGGQLQINQASSPNLLRPAEHTLHQSASTGSLRQRKQHHLNLQAIELELKRQQQHYLKVLEQQAAIFESKEKSYQTQILSRQQQIAKVTKQTVQHSIVQNLEIELRRQEDHYLKLIEQNTLIMHSKEKSYSAEIAQLRAELDKSREALKGFEEFHEKSLQHAYAIRQIKQKQLQSELQRVRSELLTYSSLPETSSSSMTGEITKLKEYYNNVLQQARANHSIIQKQLHQQLVKLRTQVIRQKRDQNTLSAVTALQSELSRQEQHYVTLLEQSSARLQSKQKSFQAEMEAMRDELKKLEVKMASQSEEYVTLRDSQGETAKESIKDLQKQLERLKQENNKLAQTSRSDLEAKLAEQDQHYKKIIDQRQENYQKEKAALHKQLDEKRKSTDNLKNSIQLKYRQLSESVNDLHVKNSEISSLQASLSYTSSEVESLKMSLEAQKSQSQQSLRQEIAQRELYFQKVLQSNAALYSSQEQKLVSQNMALRDQLDRRNQLESSKTVIQDELRKKDQRIRALEMEKMKIIGQLNIKEEEVRRQQIQSQKNLQKAKESDKKIGDLEGKLSFKENQFERINNQLAKFKSDLQNAKKQFVVGSQKEAVAFKNELAQKEHHYINLIESNRINHEHIQQRLNSQISQLNRKLESNIQANSVERKNIQSEIQRKVSDMQKQIDESKVLSRNKETSLQNENNSLKKDLQLTKAQLSSFKADGQSTKAESMNLKAELATLKGENSGLKSEILTLKNQINTFKDQFATQQKSMVPLAHFQNELNLQKQRLQSVIDRNISLYMEQQAKYEAQITSLKVQQNQPDQAQKQLQTALLKHSQLEKSYRDEIHNYKETISRLQSEVSNEKTQVTRLKGILDAEMKKSEIVQGENQHYRSEVQSLREFLGKMDEELRVQRSNQQKRIKTQEQLQTNLKKNQSEIQKLHDKNHQLEEDLMKKEAEYAKTKSSSTNLESQLNKISSSLSRLHELEGIVKNLQLQLTNSHNQMDVLHQTIAELQRALLAQSENFRKQSSHLQYQLQTERQQSISLRNIISKLQHQGRTRQVTSIQENSHQIGHLSQQIANLQKQINFQKGQNVKLRDSLENINTSFKIIQGELTKERVETSNLRKTIGELQSKLRQSSQQVLLLNNANSSLQNDLKKSQSDTQRLNLKVASLEPSQNKSIITEQSSSIEISQYKSRISSLQSDIIVLRQSQKSQKEHIQEINGLRQQLAHAHSSLQHLEHELRRQEEYYKDILDKNANIYIGKQKQFEQQFVKVKDHYTRQLELFRSNMSKQQTEYQQKLHTLQNSQGQIKKMEFELAKIQSQFVNLQKQKDVTRQELQTERTKHLSTVEQVRKDFRSRQQKLQEENHNYMSTINSLKKQLQQRESMFHHQIGDVVKKELSMQEAHFIAQFSLKEKDLQIQITKLTAQLEKQRALSFKQAQEIENKYLRQIIDLKNLAQSKDKIIQAQTLNKIKSEALAKQVSLSQTYESKEATYIKNTESLMQSLQILSGKGDRQPELLETIINLKEQIIDLERVNKELITQPKLLEQTIHQNIQYFENEKASMHNHIVMLQTELQKIKSSSQGTESYLKTIIDLKEHLQQKDKKISELSRPVAPSQEVIALRTRQTELKSQIVSLRNQILTLNSRIKNQERVSQTFDQTIKQKVKDYDVLVKEFEARSKLEASHIDRVNFLEENIAHFERQMREANSQLLKQREIIMMLQMDKKKLSEQIQIDARVKHANQHVEEKTVIAGSQQMMTKLQIQNDNLHKTMQQERLQRKETQFRYNQILKEKTVFLQKIDKLQSLLHQKERDLLKSYQQRQQNIKELLVQNKTLQSELKKIQERLLVHEFKSVLSPAPQPAGTITQHEFEVIKQQNGILGDRVRLLEAQLKDLESHNELLQNKQQQNTDKYLFRHQGERMKQNLLDIEHNNAQLFNKLNALTRLDFQRDDVMELSILKKINQEVCELVESNKLLVSQVHALENQNYSLHQTVVTLSPEDIVIQVSHSLDNVADLLQNLPENVLSTYDHYMERLDGCIQKKNIDRYMEIFQEFIREFFITLLDVLQRQATNLMEVRERMGEFIDQQIEDSQYDERGFSGIEMRREMSIGSLQSLQHLYRQYMKYRRPETLHEIGNILEASENDNY